MGKSQVKDVIVIGSGFWGAAVARRLQHEGANYSVIDNGDVASGTRNSGAYTCMKWFSSGTVAKQIPDAWTKERIQAWIDWLVKAGYLKQVGQWVYNKNRNTWKRYDDCYLMKDVSRFSNNTRNLVHGAVTEIEDNEDECTVHLAHGVRMTAKHVVLATGAWTDELLDRSHISKIGVESLGGRAVLVEPEWRTIKKKIDWNGEVISINVRPFKNYDMLPNSDNWWYFGATTEKQESEKAYDEMLNALQVVFGDSVKIKKTLWGLRPVYNGGVKKVSERVIAATGGGRIGLALAGPAAKDVMQLIRRDV